MQFVWVDLFSLLGQSQNYLALLTSILSVFKYVLKQVPRDPN